MKIKNKFIEVLIAFLLLPIFILIILFLLLYTPIDFVKYYFSKLRREMKHLYGKKAKYFCLITLSNQYKTFELIRKNKLPIMVASTFENPCKYGYFYYNQILFLHDNVPHFDFESESWYIVLDSNESNLSSYVELEKEEFYKCFADGEGIKCERVIFLVNERDVYDEEKCQADDAEFILTYNKKNFAQKIKALIEKE